MRFKAFKDALHSGGVLPSNGESSLPGTLEASPPQKKKQRPRMADPNPMVEKQNEGKLSKLCILFGVGPFEWQTKNGFFDRSTQVRKGEVFFVADFQLSRRPLPSF